MDVVMNTQDNHHEVTATEVAEETKDIAEEAETQEVESQSEDNTIQDEVKSQQATTEKLKEDLANRNVDFGALENEYNTTGTLSEKSLKQLADAGYPKEVVDAYLNGIEATQEKFYNTVIGYAGNAEEYAKVTQFVQSQGEQAVTNFNNAINSGDLGIIQLVIQGVQSKMTATNGTTNQTILGQSTGGTMGNSNAFNSKQEMLEAMDDHRYAKDPIYRQKVQQKLINSDF